MKQMTTEQHFRHVGGGPKGLFLALRYVFVIAAAYLLVFQRPHGAVPATVALTIAGALASNVMLSFVPARVLFAWWTAAPLLVGDTAWVAWALRASGAVGNDFFLLYFFVLLLAAVGEKPGMVVLGATVASAFSVYSSWNDGSWTAPVLLRVVVLYTAALFYGHVLARIRTERQRGDRTAEWARTLEAKVAERTSELRELCDGLRAASTAKSEFIASMSHELRTPLHVIIGYSDMLVDGAASTPEQGASLGRHIRTAATGFLGLIDGVLEISRLESGRVQADIRAVHVGEFVCDFRRREWIAPLPGVSLRWDVDPTPFQIDTDPVKLEIVLSNLVTNALKYTREGHVTFRVRARRDREQIDFQVEDTGPGIPEEQLAHIQEPFHESSGATGHSLAGIGLGLAIVYRYATLLGAAVSVRSKVGQGTSFRVRVGCRAPEDLAVGAGG
jgi:signal transduction histidine kinase